MSAPGVLLIEHSSGEVVAVRFASVEKSHKWLGEHPEVSDLSWRPLVTQHEAIADTQSGDSRSRS